MVSLQDEAAATQRAIRPQAVALALFAALVALIALAVIGQLLGRQLSLDSGRVPGTERPGHEPGRARGPVPGPAGTGDRGGGSVALAIIAIAASPLMPIGRPAWPSPTPG